MELTNMKTMPQIINLGLYDAASVHGNVKSTKPRRTSIYEIEYITEDGGFSYIGDKTYPIRQGGIIFAKPDTIRHTDLPYRCMYIHAVIQDETLRTLMQSVPDHFYPADSGKFKNAFHALFDETKIPKYKNDIDISINFLEILSLLAKESPAYENELLSSAKNMNIINDAVKFINENYTQNISLYDIADHVHLSKIYFHNLFLKATGETPHEYLISKRINNVKFLLTATDKAFSEIASDSGFTSQAYMTYVFKKKMNCTPMQYKKSLTSSQ